MTTTKPFTTTIKVFSARNPKTRVGHIEYGFSDVGRYFVSARGHDIPDATMFLEDSATIDDVLRIAERMTPVIRKAHEDHLKRLVRSGR